MNRTIFGTLLALSIVVTACSGDDDDADGTTAPTGAPATTGGSTDPPVTEAPSTDSSSSEAPATTTASTAASGTGLDATFGTDGILPSP